MVHFSDPENEDPMDSLRKLRFFLKYLIASYKEKSVCKGRLRFPIYIPTGTTTEYSDQPDPLPIKFDENLKSI